MSDGSAPTIKTHSSTDLQKIYKTRFAGRDEYRRRVWAVLSGFFGRWISAEACVLDLGCGYCEFINAIAARRRLAMDLNPDAGGLAATDVTMILQDCSEPWKVDPQTLDAVFSSNFLEHLPDKAAVERTLQHAWQALRSGGRVILVGPNIKYVPGAYWDFYDHYVALTERSVAEVLTKCGFEIDLCKGRFLPYTMSQGRTYPVWMLRLYLAMPIVWALFGKQFLVIGRKP